MATDPNAPIDAGTDQQYGVDPNLTGHVPSQKFLDTELVFGHSQAQGQTNPSAAETSAATVDTREFDAGYNLGTQEVAAGNVVTITDGATTSGSNVLTSASNPFTQGMFDAQASLVGPGIPVGTFIKYINSAGSIQMSQNATATATGLTIKIGLPLPDARGYGTINYPAGPAINTDSTPAGYTINPNDTSGSYGHSASFGASATYGQSLLDGSEDQQFGSQTKDDPFVGSPDTLGWSGGASTTPAGVPNTIAGYSQTVGDQLGNNEVFYGVPIFNPDGFQSKTMTGERDTTNTMFRHDGIGIAAPDNGSVTAPPTSYTLSTIETLYGYPGETAGSVGTAPTMPLNVSWVYGAGCAIVSWSPPSSTGGTTIREYTVEGYQVANPSYIPTTRTNADKFVYEPAVTWKGKGGTFMAAPVQANISAATTGGTLAAGTYYYTITAVGATGETVASNEKTVTNTGSTSVNTISWGAVTGAVSYNVYRGTSSGGEVLLANVTAPTVTYADTGAATPGSATPPAVSTAVSPNLSARVEHLTPGFYYFFRVYCRNDVGTSPMSDPVNPPSAPNNTPKYFMGYGMSGTTNTEIDEGALLLAESNADRL